MHRRHASTSLSVAALLALTGACHAGGSAGNAFTLVHIPDTQFYSQSFPATFTAQTQWIVNSKARLNIAFVNHIGDIVQNGANGGNTIEWTRADAAMDLLDGVLPYAAAVGNHDYNTVSSKASGTSAFQPWFGPTRYTSYPWFLGSASDNENFAATFTAGGYTFLNLTLEWQPDATALSWAQSQINANPGLPVIINTHEHLQDADTSGNGAGRTGAGNFTFNSLIQNNPSIFMIECGHHHRGHSGFDGEHHQFGVNIAGSEVFEFLSDYQDYAVGGQGWLRYVKFDVPNDQLLVRTYSVSLNQFQDDALSRFAVPFDFARRFATGTPPAPKFSTRVFQEGQSGYAGTSDTQLSSATPAAAAGGAVSISVDALDGTPSGPTAGLIRFDGLFGAGAGQIASDSDVLHAKLRVNIVNPGSFWSFHRMLTAWDENATWNSLTAGITADGVEAMGAPEAFLGANNANAVVPNGFLDLDVTASLRAWMNGATNHGWAVLPASAGTNGIDFNTSENATASTRPQLIVTVPTEPVSVKTFRQGLNGYAGTIDTELRQADPATAQDTNALMTIDADDPNASGNDTQGLLKFDGLFGNGAGQVPAGARVTSAQLLLNVTDFGSGFTVHRMIAPWATGATWNSLGNGVSLDDAEGEVFMLSSAGANASSAAIGTGTLYLDVTEAVQAWIAGSPNNGLLLRPFANASNGVDFSTSEAATATQRPTLVVRYIAPPPPPVCVGDINNDQAVNTTDLTLMLGAFGTCAGDAGYLAAADFDASGCVNTLDLTTFLGAFGTACR
ncbi:MAG: DNRLRE domain-containing protein [Phycisphaerales bacterium]